MAEVMVTPEAVQAIETALQPLVAVLEQAAEQGGKHIRIHQDNADIQASLRDALANVATALEDIQNRLARIERRLSN
jgi:predicted RNase H-like nuclease (RuvC/YqgF family)